jgi:hypothetical protein
MAWMSLLSAQLERCRRTERLRERASQVGPYVDVTAGLAAAAAAGSRRLLLAGTGGYRVAGNANSRWPRCRRPAPAQSSERHRCDKKGR